MVGTLDGKIDPVIDRIYDCTSDPRALPEVLEWTAGQLDSHSAILFTPNLAPERGGLNILYNHDPDAIRAYRDHFHALDLWWHAGQKRACHGETGVVTDDELVPRRELERSEFHNDFLRRVDTYHVIAADMRVVSQETHFTVSLAFHGDSRHPGFDSLHRVLVEALLPHLRRAIRLSLRVGNALDGLRCAISAFESLGDGVLLLAENGRVLHATRVAESMLGSASALRLVSGRLTARSVRETQQLAHALSRASSRAGAACAGSVAVTSPTSRHPLIVSIFPLPCRETPFAEIGGARMLAIVRDSSRKGVPKWSLFASHFGITPAELRLCQALSQDTTLPEYCAEHAITENTARSQLKSVFCKTAVRRQSELMRLIQAFS